MFSNNAWVKIWKCEKGQGNYYVAQMSTSRKNNNGEYETDWSDGRVRLVGEAANQAKGFKGGERLQIANCGVTNTYDKEKKTVYTNYVVFSFADVAESAPAKQKAPSKRTSKKQEDASFMNVPDTDDDELPFN